MKNCCVILVLLALVFSCFAGSEEIVLSRSAKQTGVQIVSDNLKVRGNAHLVLEAHVQSLRTSEVKTSYGTFTNLEIPGWQHTYNVGEPKLPVLTQIVEVPQGGEITVKVQYSSSKEDAGNRFGVHAPIYPTQPSQRKDEKDVPFAYNMEVYQGSYRNEDLVSVEEIGTMRGMRLVLVHFRPVQYNPAANLLTVHNDIRVEMTVEKADVERTMENKKKYASPYFGWIYPNMLLPKSLYFESVRADKKYLIIADPMFRSNPNLKQFVDWKKSMGFVVVLSFTDEIGGNAIANIQKYVKEQYQASLPPTFVLLVGDLEQIPATLKQAPSRGSKHYTDLYYFTVDGDDYLPDILYGRFSAANDADLNAQIEKTLSYEKREFSDPGFLTRYTLVAGWDGNWAVKRGYPQIRFAMREHFRKPAYEEAIDDDSDPAQSVFLTKRSGHTPDKIFAHVNRGVCFFNYTAHGDESSFADPSFTMSDIDRMQNKGMYPLVVGNCCLTGSFERATCFGEKWLRAPQKGAIGYIGGSNYTYWDEDLWFGVGYCTLTSAIDGGAAPEKAETIGGMYDAAFKRLHKGSNAGIMMAGNLAVTKSPNSKLKQYYWEVYHFFGDPSLEPIWANQDQTPPPDPPVYIEKVFEKNLSSPLPIPDNNASGVQDTLKVQDSFLIAKLDVYLDINHTYVGDVTVILTHVASGKKHVVREKVGGGADNVVGWQGANTTFKKLDSKGDWTLLVKDTASSDTGALNGWKIKVYYEKQEK
ncbi:MAG: proprotein convertase P-domain-containing protein [Candidatus Brocadiae bacterium]|nr:proprotein convertase P-domain-containing protein [Candidatus Brocadiia bacterium]